MTLTSFELLVHEMRKAQKQLSQKETQDNLLKVKRLEHSVDKFLEVQQNQPKETFFAWENPRQNNS